MITWIIVTKTNWISDDVDPSTVWYMFAFDLLFEVFIASIVVAYFRCF